MLASGHWQICTARSHCKNSRSKNPPARVLSPAASARRSEPRQGNGLRDGELNAPANCSNEPRCPLITLPIARASGPPETFVFTFDQSLASLRVPIDLPSEVTQDAQRHAAEICSRFEFVGRRGLSCDASEEDPMRLDCSAGPEHYCCCCCCCWKGRSRAFPRVQPAQSPGRETACCPCAQPCRRRRDFDRALTPVPRQFRAARSADLEHGFAIHGLKRLRVSFAT